MGEPYHDEKWLRGEYVDKRRTTTEIADECGVTATTISDWLDRHDIGARSQQEAQKPDAEYTDREWLYTEYVENGRSMKDIGEECGVSGAVILKWLRRFDIETRHSAQWRREMPLSLSHSNGYPFFKAKHDGNMDYVGVHQLLAIADGADPHKVFSDGEYHVHHGNGVKWDNRPENIEVLRREEHLSHHFEEREQRDTGELK